MVGMNIMPAGTVNLKADDDEGVDEVYNIIMTPGPAEQTCAAWAIKKVVPQDSKMATNVEMQLVAENCPGIVKEWFSDAVFDVDVEWYRPTLKVDNFTRFGQTILARAFAPHELSARQLAIEKKEKKAAEKDVAKDKDKHKRRLEQCDSAPDAEDHAPLPKMNNIVEMAVMA